MLLPVSASMGLMPESTAERLCAKGGPHYGSPHKHLGPPGYPRLGGAPNIPFTTGILIGIGETRAERIESLLALRALHEPYGHIQEIIIQNFLPKPDTAWRNRHVPAAEQLLWTIAVPGAVGPPMSIQAPPNLIPAVLGHLTDAGVNDWGGASAAYT